MADGDVIFGQDDELPAWAVEDLDDIPEELDGLDAEGMLEEPVP